MFETPFCIDLGIPIKSKHRAEDVLEYLGPNAAPPEDIEWVGYNFCENHIENVQIDIKFIKFVSKSCYFCICIKVGEGFHKGQKKEGAPTHPQVAAFHNRIPEGKKKK